MGANNCTGGALTMVNKHCAYGECRSDSRYIHKSFMQGVFFIKFPIVKKRLLNRSAENLIDGYVLAHDRILP